MYGIGINVVSDDLARRPQHACARQLLESMPGWEKTNPIHKENTPKRFVESLLELTTPQPFEFTVFVNGAEGAPRIDEMVTVGPIPFAAVCAHHVIPFVGTAWVSYVPDNRVAGLSKFARLVREEARGFWVQEELTQSIANKLEAALSPLGVGVVMKAEHQCMSLRGANVPGVITITSAMKGVYLDETRGARSEFLEFIRN